MEKSLEILLRGNQFKLLLERNFKEFRSHYDLKKVDLDILHYLFRCGGQSNTSRDIQEALRINKGYISQSVYGMQERGFIIPVIDEHDRRKIHLYLTDTAKKICEEICSQRQALLDVIFHGVTPAERKALEEIATKMNNNVGQILSQCKREHRSLNGVVMESAQKYKSSK